MKRGQKSAILELHRLQASGDGVLDFEEPTESKSGWVSIDFSIRIGALSRRPGGLVFKERESMNLLLPPVYPFQKPLLTVGHNRFAGFPHVDWGRGLCLYQSDLEWNPSDGLYGFFTRLSQWLGKAAANDMDPAEGPLHPPVLATVRSHKSFLISTNSPVATGTKWLGFASLVETPNRFEVTRWVHVEDPTPPDAILALVLILPAALPMHFPSTGADLFAEMHKQDVDQEWLIRYLAIASLCGKVEDPVYLIVGTPSLRDAEGKPRHHFAVWAIDYRKSLRSTLPQDADNAAIGELRKEMIEILIKLFSLSKVSWCRVLENRPEIVVRRDRGRPMSWFLGKRILILGCGAIGSWAAEMIARAEPASVDLVDSGEVKPGLLVRQNYTRADMGANKAKALEARLTQLISVPVVGYACDALEFLFDDLDKTAAYDLILDCTASRSFQMELESRWSELGGKVRRLASAVIDNRAEHLLSVDLGETPSHGPWMGYIRLKTLLCAHSKAKPLLDGFYSDQSINGLFQPEPGCSDPTFAGSSADMQGLVASFLNLIAGREDNAQGVGYGLSQHNTDSPPVNEIEIFPGIEPLTVGDFRVFVSPAVFERARTFVEANNKARSKRHETGGLIWGYWDEAAGVIEISDVSGPPPDSEHKPSHFRCGTKGTRQEHERRLTASRGNGGFIGMWHTHPNMAPLQSEEDVMGMAKLVASGEGQNRRKALMMIFGRPEGRSEASIYAYESILDQGNTKSVGVGHAVFALPVCVV